MGTMGFIGLLYIDMYHMVRVHGMVGTGVLGVTKLEYGVGTLSDTIGYDAETRCDTVGGVGVTPLGVYGFIMIDVAGL